MKRFKYSTLDLNQYPKYYSIAVIIANSGITDKANYSFFNVEKEKTLLINNIQYVYLSN